MTRRALVTGAGGFIGSHLVERLVSDGYSVRAMVHYNALGRRGWLDDSPVRTALEVIAGDIADAGFVRQAVRGVDVVFHLAALIGIPYSYIAPRSYVATNVQGTLNVLEAAREAGTRVIQTSTSEVYGTAQRVPIDEDHPLSAQSPYAATKIAADQMSLAYHRSFGLPVVVVRPFNTYGPRQSPRAVLPAILLQLLAGSEVIRLGALAPTRDLVYVQDTVAGFALAAGSDAAVGQILQLGTGYEVSIGDLAQIAAEVMGRQVRIEQDAQRLRPATSEVERLIADAGKAHGLLGWQPTRHGRDGLRAGIAETIEWLERHRAVDQDLYAV